MYSWALITGDTPVTVDARAFRQSLGTFPTGVCLVTTMTEHGKREGMTINSFASVSLDPPLILWSIRDDARSGDAFINGRHFILSVLAASQRDLALHFSKPSADKFADHETQFDSGLAGCPRLKGSVASFECSVYSRHQEGDHTILLGRVEAHSRSTELPLLLHMGQMGSLWELASRLPSVQRPDNPLGQRFAQTSAAALEVWALRCRRYPVVRHARPVIRPISTRHSSLRQHGVIVSALAGGPCRQTSLKRAFSGGLMSKTQAVDPPSVAAPGAAARVVEGAQEASTQSPRYAFDPIINRKPMAFPGGKRLAILIYVNIEHVPFGSTAAAHAVYPGTMQFSPDILNHGWRDYGNRVGLWRIMKAMDRHGFRGTVNLNSDVCREYPQIIREGNLRNWEWGVQGDNNTSVPCHMPVAQQREFIARNIAIVQRATGKRPKGWLSMFLAESPETPDLLAEAGIEYVSNYAHDELPVEMHVKSGSLVTMPYTLEINDVPTIAGKGASGEVFGQMIKDQFDVLYEEAIELPRVMSISLHPFISGHPFRMKHIEAALAYIASHSAIWKTTGGEVSDWYRESCLGHAARRDGAI